MANQSDQLHQETVYVPLKFDGNAFLARYYIHFLLLKFSLNQQNFAGKGSDFKGKLRPKPPMLLWKDTHLTCTNRKRMTILYKTVPSQVTSKEKTAWNHTVICLWTGIPEVEGIHSGFYLVHIYSLDHPSSGQRE